jgi:hypothetical protein
VGCREAQPISANLRQIIKSGETFFFASPTHHKIVILSGAPHRFIA